MSIETGRTVSGCTVCGKMDPLYPDNKCSTCSVYQNQLSCCTCYYLWECNDNKQQRFRLVSGVMRHMSEDCHTQGIDGVKSCENYHNMPPSKKRINCKNKHVKVVYSHFRK